MPAQRANKLDRDDLPGFRSAPCFEPRQGVRSERQWSSKALVFFGFLEHDKFCRSISRDQDYHREPGSRREGLSDGIVWRIKLFRASPSIFAL
jgi:hypothetical protein